MSSRRCVGLALLLAMLPVVVGGCCLKVTNTDPNFDVTTTLDIQPDLGQKEFVVQPESTSSVVCYFSAANVLVVGQREANPDANDFITVNLTAGQVVCLEFNGNEWTIAGTRPLEVEDIIPAVFGF